MWRRYGSEFHQGLRGHCACFAQVLLIGLAPITLSATVEFPHPPHLKITPSGQLDGKYEVHFRWEAPSQVSTASVAGSFNHWNPGNNVLERGPDGWFSGTVTMSGGSYRYKFVGDGSRWVPDPLNSDTEPDGHGSVNSILRVGLVGALHGVEGLQGDGVIEKRALLHDPMQHTYLDPLSESDGYIRFRTLAHDVDVVALVLVARDGGEERHLMELVGGDDLFDYYQFRVRPWHLEVLPAVTAYSFEVIDGELTHRMADRFPMVLDRDRIVSVPEWAKGAVWYQIMVDRFRDGDPTNNPEYTPETGRVNRTNTWTADHTALEPWEVDGDKGLFQADGNRNNFPDIYERLYGGDFQGLIDRMDYLADLGVTAIYLNPVFEATSHHKYNGKCFVHTDDGYGVPGEFARAWETHDPLDRSTWIYNESDLIFFEVVRAAREQGLRLVIDGVFNHKGDDAPVFRDVREKGRDSRFADWFNIESWEPFRYEGWGGFGGMPVFDKTDTGFPSESLTEYLFAVTERWLAPDGEGLEDLGIDGWRMDVADEVPLPFWQKWRKHAKAINPDALLIGEIWPPAERHLDGTAFDATMNYPFRNVVLDFFGNVEERISASEFQRRLGRLLIRYPTAITHAQQNLVDSHDVDRIASRLMNPDLTGDDHYDSMNSLQEEWAGYDASRPDAAAYHRLRLVSLFQFTWIGSPMVYYGTEVGMYGADDPINRKPMWWEDLEFENPDYRPEPGLLEWYQQLGALRADWESLRRGKYRPVLADDGQEVFAFTRELEETGERFFIILNNSESPATVESPVGALGGMPIGEPLIALGEGVELSLGRGGDVVFSLPPVSGAVFLLGVPTVPQVGVYPSNPSMRSEP